MLPQSDFIWSNIKIWQNIQFPWRLLAVTPLCGGCLVAWLISQKPSWWIGAFFIIIVLYANRNYLRTWERARYLDSHYLTNKVIFNNPPDLVWEYLPVWVDTPPKVSSENNPPQAKNNIHFIIDALYPKSIIINKFYFPNWEIKVDKHAIPITPTPHTGLITFSLSSGNHVIDGRIVSTTLERFSDWLSLISFLFWLLLIYLSLINNDKLVKYIYEE